MKNKKIILAGTLVALLSATGLASCGGGKGESIDKTKTQIYVNNYNRGFGSEFIEAIKARFEKQYANYDSGDGKKGVQVIIHTTMDPVSANPEKYIGTEDEIFFTEQTALPVLLDKDMVHDITDVVTETIDGEQKSIEDKLNDTQKNYFKRDLDGSGTEKYYALPHYSGFFGITYNKSLFESRNYYFSANPDPSIGIEGYFVANAQEARSAGPDGISGTSDDGLPSSYDEFVKMCEFMASEGTIPLTFNGALPEYLSLLLMNFIYNDMGAEQAQLTYTSDGLAKNLVEINDQNEVVNVADVQLTANNGYELYKSKARLDALELYEQLGSTKGGKSRYTDPNVNKSTFNAANAQYSFLTTETGLKVDGQQKTIAMLADGCWWQREASQSIAEIADSKGQQFSAKNRDFAFMPLPTSTNRGEHKNVIFDHLNSICYMKKDIDSNKYDLLKKFLQFCNSDESLVEFSTITNTMKDLNYTISSADLEKMTPFGRSVYDVKAHSDIVYHYGDNAFYNTNYSFLKFNQNLHTTFGSSKFDSPLNVIDENNSHTAKEYFKNSYEYFQEKWPSK